MHIVKVKLLTELGEKLSFQEGINITVTESTLQKAMMNAIENAAQVFSLYEKRPDTLRFEATGKTPEGEPAELQALVNYNLLKEPETIKIINKRTSKIYQPESQYNNIFYSKTLPQSPAKSAETA